MVFASPAGARWSPRSAFAPQRAARGAGTAGGALDAVAFSKYQGLGNDFLLVDNRASKDPVVSPQEAAKMCDRNFGVGADGVIFVLPAPEGSDEYDVTMRIYNSDSSEPEMCGNGIRCMARYMATELGLAGRAAGTGAVYNIMTGAGKIVPVVRPDGQITVDMGEPVLVAASVPTTLAATTAEGTALNAPIECAGRTFAVTCVSMGNPHAIAFVDDVAAFNLDTFGPVMEAHPAFPKKINAEFAEVQSRSRIQMRVWERGAGPTLACGTGACATAVAGVLTGLADRTCTVGLPGGDLEIEWREADNRIYMTGPAEFVFSGSMAA